MPGRGPAPKEDSARARANAPERPWQTATGVGWQHGKTPAAPTGLMPASREAWKTWMASWFAAYWTPADLPGLRMVIRLYDEVERGEFQRSSELRISMDTYGITPKGQQDRRWKPPVESKPEGRPAAGGRYSHLRAVSDAG